jgi:hypothetical protein
MSTEQVQDEFPNSEEEAAVLRLVSGLPWGDVCEDIIAFEKALRTLLYATGNDAVSWRRTGDIEGPYDRWEEEVVFVDDGGTLCDRFGDGSP